jgi:hypothetical protein
VYKQGSPAKPQTSRPWNLIGSCMTTSPPFIAQQYSSTTFVSLGFHTRKDKSDTFKKHCFFPVFFSLLKFLKTEIL